MTLYLYCNFAGLLGCRKVKTFKGANSKGWAESAPMVGIGLIDVPNIRGASAVVTPVPASLLPVKLPPLCVLQSCRGMGSFVCHICTANVQYTTIWNFSEPIKNW